MTWFKVDDGLHASTKARRAGEAMALWVMAGSWCASQLTDGWVPQDIAEMLAPKKWRAWAAKLVDVRLWIVEEKDGVHGWSFHDWGDYQPKKEDVIKEREANKERQKRRREALRHGGSHGVTGAAPDRENSRRDQNETTVSGRRDQNETGFLDRSGGSHDMPSEDTAAGQGQTSRRDTSRDSRRESRDPDPTRPDPTYTGHGPSTPPGRTAHPHAEEAPPTDAEPSRVEKIITEYRDNSPRGIPSRQAEKLAVEIHTLIRDGYTDNEIRFALAQLRVRKLGPTMLPGLVDELANTLPGANVIPITAAGTRPSTTDQRVASTLALGARLQAEAERKELGG